MKNLTVRTPQSIDLNSAYSTPEGSPVSTRRPESPEPDTSAFVRYVRAESAFHDASVAMGLPGRASVSPRVPTSPFKAISPTKAENQTLKVALTVERGRSEMLEARLKDLQTQFSEVQRELHIAHLAFAQLEQQLPPSRR